jgi:hypothetical protein
MVRAEARGFAEHVMMHPGKELGSAFDRGYVKARAPDTERRERTSEQKAADAETIADNFDHQLEFVRAAVAAMTAAVGARDLAAWTTAKGSADQALRQLEHLAPGASAAASDAIDPDVKQRLVSADQVLQDVQNLVAQAPAAPPATAPEPSCSAALLAALPPDPPPVGWRDADFRAAADAVAAVCASQMTTSDIAAFRTIVALHKDHAIARRFRRFGEERRGQLLQFLDQDNVKLPARAREVARRAEVAARAGDRRAAEDVQPAPADITPTPGSEDSEGRATVQTGARDGAAEPRALDDAAPREALGPAIAARVPGVTYEGTGRFVVAAGERSVMATIQRVDTGVARVRRDADDAAILEIPTGLDENELAAAVAAQLRALQLQPGPQHATLGGSAPLPPDVRADMEQALGADFSGVRVHQDGQAEGVGALAFTRGTDIHFAPGHYDPHSSPGRQLLGHELTHVAQQAQGRVSPTAQVNGQATNNDPALEQEADSKGALAASTTDGATVPTMPPRPGTAAPLQAKAAPATSDGRSTTSEVAADVATAAPIQRQRDEHKPQKQHIPYRIPITRPMTGEEFKVAAHLQVFGAVIASDWHNVKDAYTPADSPVEILVDAELFHRGRGLANAARGIETDATGAVIGGDERARDFQRAPASDEKTALLDEIDRRYYAASGAAEGSKIKPGELGRAELWRTIRDEVLFQSAYLANLPEKVRAVIRVSITGRELSPADYDQVFRIAKKIENLPAGQAADYASKITGQSASLDELEAAIERYRGGVAAREHQDQERSEVHNKLLGLEEVYKTYRAYIATPAEAMAPDAREQLEQQLGRYGFASIGEFTTYITKYEQAFEDGAAAITLDILAKYAGKLHRESQRYQDPEVIKTLHGKLGGFRAQHQEFDKNSKIESAEVWKAEHTRDAEVRRLPGNGGMPEKPPTRERVEASQKAKAAKANAEAQIKDLSKEYPIFAEDELPRDKRLDKVALAGASEAELAGVLQAHIANRQAAVDEARAQLEGKHALVYKMEKLMPTFFAQLGIQPGSIHDQIIQDKLHSDAVAKIVTGIVVAIVTVALTVVSLGTATPAVLAAGASIGAAGISTYMAYDAYKEYTEEHAIAEAGFANDPSVVWLVLAVLGAGADMASAVNVISKLGPAARTLGEATRLGEADGKLIDFTKAVEKLREAKEIDEKIAAAANKAAAARTSYAAAKDQFKADLRIAASGARGALGPFTDPTVFRGLVKMAVAKIREGVHSLEEFIAQLKKVRIDAQLGEMSPEELVKAKEAWAQAEALSKQAKDPELLDKLLERGVDPATIEQLTAKLDDAAVRQLIDHGLTPAQVERLAKMTEPQLKRLLALSRDQVAAFARLSDGAFARYTGLADNVFTKFAGLDATGIERFGALSDAAFAKFAALDAPMLQSFAALDVETLRSFAFFDDAVLRRFGSIPSADLAKLTGIDTIALRDFEALEEKALRELLANHSAEDIRILGNMTPQKWAEAHASASSLDAEGGHSFAKHGAHTTAAQQETRLREGIAPDGSMMATPPTEAGRFASDAAHMEAAKLAEQKLYDNMVRTNGRLKQDLVTRIDVPGAGFSYRLDPPGIPPPPYTGGRVVETMCNRVHAYWKLNSAGTDYVLYSMYPIP